MPKDSTTESSFRPFARNPSKSKVWSTMSMSASVEILRATPNVWIYMTLRPGFKEKMALQDVYKIITVRNFINPTILLYTATTKFMKLSSSTDSTVCVFNFDRTLASSELAKHSVGVQTRNVAGARISRWTIGFTQHQCCRHRRTRRQWG